MICWHSCSTSTSLPALYAEIARLSACDRLSLAIRMMPWRFASKCGRARYKLMLSVNTAQRHVRLRGQSGPGARSNRGLWPEDVMLEGASRCNSRTALSEFVQGGMNARNDVITRGFHPGEKGGQS